jgi:hypothetical protein
MVWAMVAVALKNAKAAKMANAKNVKFFFISYLFLSKGFMRPPFQAK